MTAVPPRLGESSPAAELGQQAPEERSSSHAGHNSSLMRAAAAERGRCGRSGLQSRGNQGAADASSIHREGTTAGANIPEGPIAQRASNLDGDSLAGDHGGLRGRGSHRGRGSSGGATRASMRRDPPTHAASRRTLDQGHPSRKRRASRGDVQDINQEHRPKRRRRPTEKAAGAKQPQRRKRRRLKRLYNNEVRGICTSMHACCMDYGRKHLLCTGNCDLMAHVYMHVRDKRAYGTCRSHSEHTEYS